MRARGHRLGAFVVTAFLVTGFTAIPASADQWNKVQSSHFLIVGDVDHVRLSYIARTLEQFRLAVGRAFPERPLAATQPLTIVVLNGAGILEYGPGRSGNVGGYYQATSAGDYIVMASRSLGGSDFSVVLHEYQHLIVRAAGVQLPRWANEGLAEFYSTFQESKGGKQFEIGRIAEGHLRTLAQNGITPLEEFFTDDGRAMQMNEVFRVGNFYAQSWALVHFFHFGEEGKWADKFPAFLDALASGHAVRPAFEQTVGSLDSFEAAFRLYPKKPQFSFMRFESQDVGERQLGSQRSKLSVAETETLRATLMNDPAKAQKSLETALSADPAHRPALALRAARLVFARETTRAAEELVRVTDGNETDLQSCSLAMFALNALGRFDQALATCRGAKQDAGISFERVVSLEGAGRSREVGPYFAALSQARQDEFDALGWRSWRYLEEGRYTAAIRAADLVSARGSGSPDTVAYQRFVKMVSGCLSNQCADARADLKRVSIPPAATAWVHHVFRFLTDELDAGALLKEATRPEEETEGHAYIALELVGRGQTNDALPHLRWIAEKGSPNVTEYYVAVAHLKRLPKP